MSKKLNKKKQAILKHHVSSSILNNYQNLRFKDYTIKQIAPDGNCFYRSLSYYYRDTESDYGEFRHLIAEYIIQNAGDYINFIPEEDLNINTKSEINDEEIKKKFNI